MEESSGVEEGQIPTALAVTVHERKYHLKYFKQGAYQHGPIPAKLNC